MTVPGPGRAAAPGGLVETGSPVTLPVAHPGNGPGGGPGDGPGGGSRARWRRRWLVLLAVAGVFLLLSLVRWLTGASDVTSSGTARAAIALAVPIGLAGLGGLWSERAGVVNIGLEGMMILGTWFGAWAGFQYGPWAGVLAGVLGGAVGGLVHAVATVSFGVDQIVSGVAVTILGGGLARYLSVVFFTGTEGGGPTQSPSVPDIATITVPGVSPALRSLESRGVPVVSDLAGILGGVTTELSYLTVLAVLLVPLSYAVLWHTTFGLRLRACGEAPYAAESLGVNVYLYKYVAVVMSGALSGLAGAFLVIVASSIYREGQTGGRGYIGLAAMIFGNWRPGGLAIGAGLFGYADGLQLRQSEAVHALLLFVAALLVTLAAWQLSRGRRVAGVVSLTVGLLVGVLFAVTDSVPEQLVTVTPYLTTLLVLGLASQRLRPPAADGLPYRRGQGG